MEEKIIKKNKITLEKKEMEDFTFNIGYRLANLRSKNHYTLERAVTAMQLEGIDITVKTLSNYECGRSKIDIFKLSQVAKFYSVTTDYILYGIESTPTEQLTELANSVPEKLFPHLLNLMKEIVKEINFYCAEI